MKCKADEVLLSGPAGTGKSRACLEKMHLLATHVAGFRGLILRRTRESLTSSALVTFEQHVVEQNHPILKTGGQRNMRQSYKYPNGSEIVVGGLDKPGKIMSTEYDAAYIQEAIEVEEDAWEAITTRLRNGKLPYQQLMADTNPGAPTHWLKKRCDAGRTVLIPCHHEDNPVFFQRGQWTPRGVDYIKRLDALTGPRKMRLRHGRWVQAEGVVYEGWDPHVHLIDRFVIPPEWRRWWSVDFGYTNPFVALMFAENPDGVLYLYREVYVTRMLVEDAARRLLDLEREHAMELALALGRDAEKVRKLIQPQAIICDHDAEDRATLTRHLGRGTTPARKDVRPGIEAVATRLRVQGNGKARLYILRDSLDRRDRALEDAKRPCSIVEEFDCYIWNDKVSKDEPVKENDHALDCLRYLAHRGNTLSDRDIPGFAPPAKMQRPKPTLHLERGPIRRTYGKRR